MNPPRILLIGKNGQLGWELQHTLATLGQVICVGRKELDLADADAIRKQIRTAAPNIVVNAAAYTAVDRAESEPDLAMKINGAAPGIIAGEAKQLGALLIHFSTDYIFDGTKTSPYVEADTPNPLNVYGRTKLAGEQAIQQAGARHLIFRLCWVYSLRGANFLLTIMRLAREREKLRVVRDQIGSPTWSRTIAEATASVLKQVLAAGNTDEFNGAYHLCASGATSWHGFAKSIVSWMPEADRKCKEIEAITTLEYPTPAKRPACSVLSCEKAKRTFGLQLPDWEESLKQVFDQP